MGIPGGKVCARYDAPDSDTTNVGLGKCHDQREPVAGLVMVIVALGTTAPDEPVTVRATTYLTSSLIPTSVTILQAIRSMKMC
jgi:hypothetical protein